VTEARTARDRAGRPGIGQWLFDPFVYVAGGRSLIIGIVAIVIAGYLGSLSRTHFDGVLDMHTGLGMPTWVFLLEGIVDWLSLGLVLFIAGKLVTKTSFRARDLFGTQAMARWPTVLIAAVALAPGYQRFVWALARQLARAGPPVALSAGDIASFVPAMLVIVLALIWMVVLMYRSYSICCNVRGLAAAVSFVIGLLVAEAGSKLAVIALLRAA